MSRRRNLTALGRMLAAGTALALGLTGCAGPTGPGVPAPTGVPPHPDGLVVGFGFVLQKGDAAAELCFSVLTSRPPQCSGIPLLGWDWSAVDGSESALDVTWGDYVVLGRYDGETITVTDTAARDDYTPPPQQDDPLLLPENAGTTSEADLLAYQLQLHSEAPFPIDSSGATNGYLFVTVHWDDGTYQSWLDRRFGPGVAQVRSMLQAVGSS